MSKKEKPKATKPTLKRNTVAERVAKTKADLLIALEKSLGVVTSACKAVGIDRTAYYEYMREDAEFAAKVTELKNLALDFGESMLHQNMRKGDTSSIIFFLKTQGKARGYIERQELTGKDGGAIGIEIENVAKLSDEELRKIVKS